MIAAATKPIQQAQTTYDTQSQGQQQNITGLTQALAGILGGIAPGVQKTYQTAADSQAAFAKGFSDQMQQRLGQNATDTSSFLQNIVGAPASQIADVAGKVNPAGAADTLYGLRGFIPASTLNEEGAAYTANAQMLPGIANSQGLQQIGKVQAAQRAQDATFAQQIASEAAKGPEYGRQIGNDLFNQAYKRATLRNQNASLGLRAQNQSFNQKATVARLNMESQKFARSQLQSDRSYSLALSSLGLRQAANQRAAIAAEYKLANGGYTSQQVNKFKAILQTGINSLTLTPAPNGMQTVVATDPNPKNKTGWKKVGNVYEKPVTYSEFVGQSVSHGAPLSLAINRANQFFPVDLRPDPKTLAKLTGISPAAAQAATGQTTGVDNLIRAASFMLGTPYVWGGNNPGKALDCSGFLQQTYKQIGISIPRTTYQQVKAGKRVALNQLQPGDAIFTIPSAKGPKHVAMFIGNGQVQVSPTTGDVNKIMSLQDYLKLGFVAARRYLGNR